MQEHADHPDSVQTDGQEVRHHHSDVSRWLAAASYLFFICIFVAYEVKVHRRDDYVRFHARQGFALCFVEVILIILTFILGATLGTIPVLGAIIMIVYKLVAGLLAVGLSVWGFVEALGGEEWEMPILGEYAKRVPLN
jgi:uncharacterized membrane protein